MFWCLIFTVSYQLSRPASSIWCIRFAFGCLLLDNDILLSCVQFYVPFNGVPIPSSSTPPLPPCLQSDQPGHAPAGRRGPGAGGGHLPQEANVLQHEGQDAEEERPPDRQAGGGGQTGGRRAEVRQVGGN